MHNIVSEHVMRTAISRKDRSLLLAAAACLTQCGPTPQQEGELVFTMAPFMFLLGVGLQWPLLSLWRRKWAEIELRWMAPNLIILGGLFVLGGIGFQAVMNDSVWQGIPLLMALLGFACSYLAVLLITTRVWLLFDRKRVFWLSHPIVAVMMVAPALPLFLGRVREQDTWYAVPFFLWHMPLMVFGIFQGNNFAASVAIIVLIVVLLAASLVREAATRAGRTRVP